MKSIHTDAAPAAIGPYSQAIAANGMLFVSGQIPLDPSNGEVVPGGLSAQTRQVLDNLKAVVTAADASMADIVKVTVYICDMQQFGNINEIYGEYFQEPFPARACVEVSALPKGVEVEMDAIVVLN